MKETKLTFKRYENKYVLSGEQYAALRKALEGRIHPDEYFKSTVCSIYYDDETYQLIRHSISAPVYKEKLRLRSYNVPGEDSTVFVELKKKFEGVVYKRRVGMKMPQARQWLSGGQAPEDNQITREINWFIRVNDPQPKVFIACEREAYVADDNEDLRITFDMNLRWRDDELELTHGSDGLPLMNDGEVLMEIKIPGAAPLWLADILSALKIFPQGYSKYGTCYRNNLLHKQFNGVNANV